MTNKQLLYQLGVLREKLNLGPIIAFVAVQHKDQVDKGGFPNVLHPLRVAQSIYKKHRSFLAEKWLLVAMQAALGHDLLEDCLALTPADILHAGFLPESLTIIQRLTKNQGTDYQPYIGHLVAGPCGSTTVMGALTCLVKYEDNSDNMEGSRIPDWDKDPASVKRMKKYMTAHNTIAHFLTTLYESRESLAVLA